jgi:AAA domain
MTVANGTTQTVAELAERKRLPLEFLRDDLGWHDLEGGGVGIPYYSEDGTELFVRERDRPAGPRFRQPKGRDLEVFGLWRLDEVSRAGLVFFCEGESDTAVLWYHGLPALGLPGSNSAGCLSRLPASVLDGLHTVYVVPDGDQGGEAMAREVPRQLQKRDFRGRVWLVRLPSGIKDVSDLHADDPDAFCARWEVCVKSVERIQDARGDSWEEQPSAPGGQEPRGGDGSSEGSPCPGWTFSVVDSATFSSADYRPTWLVRRLLVARQPVIVGGPRKALKTSLVVDLAVSLGSGTPFLGEFASYRRCKVALLSGESGEFTLQETARRVCTARGLNLAAVEVLWGFTLPQLANPADLAVLEDGLRQARAEVVIIDPLYLALLAGQGPRGLQASNLFDMGPLLLGVAQACLAAGCTPILIHHSVKRLATAGEPLELEDLAFAGTQEFARQWLLLSRREPFVPGTGSHRLWLSAGGSTGQGGLWALDIEEGTLTEDFGGRMWEVAVRTSGDERDGQADTRRSEKDRSQRQQVREDGTMILCLIDRIADSFGVAVYSHVRAESHLSNDRLIRALNALIRDGRIEEVEAEIATGRGKKVRREVRGLRRVSGLSGQCLGDSACPDTD